MWTAQHCSNPVFKVFFQFLALRQGGQQSSAVAKETVTSVQLDPGPSAPPLTPALKEVLSPVQVCSPSRQTTPGIPL